MAIVTVCSSCGRSFEFDDDYAGQSIKCPDCSTMVMVPAAPPRAPQADPVFERDVFLIRQKIRIDAKYAVTDEQGNPVLFIVRPAYFLRGLGAILAGITAGIAICVAGFALVGVLGESTAAGALAGIFTTVAALAGFVATAVALSKKRHTTIYRDESMTETLVTVEQDRKFQPIIATYTVRDAKGKVLARLRKNYLYNIIRKRWIMVDPAGREIMVAMEDSWVKAFLRRWLGPLFGALRTNFILLADGTDEIGQFNRNFTILDRYVLDLSGDKKRKFDRRLALALGVMLDTGERR
jgi:DNA-directed RNA polymerase subunit RPC12/RpoP